MLAIYLLVSSADNLCKQFGPRLGATKLFQEYHQCQNQVLHFVGPDFDADGIPENVHFEKNKQTTKIMKNYPACKEL